MTVRVVMKAVKNLQARVTNAANFLGRDGLRPILQQSGREAVIEFRRNIDRMNPGPVADLAPSTKKQKMRKYGRIYPILFASGQMYDGMKTRVFSPSGRDGWRIHLEFGKRTAGSSADIAEGHITGAGNLPKRDFLKLPKQWRQNLLADIRRALQAQRRL